MGRDNLISIIMPSYNAEKYIAEAIQSVLNQEYKNWELLIINDGSSDKTEEIILQFKDPRINYFKQGNQGVSIARNIGLANMKGDFFCFLDADDLMTKKSLTSRVKILEDLPSIDICGGGQIQKNTNLNETLQTQKAEFDGKVLKHLFRLNEKCFINCGTWLIRRQQGINYSFPKGWTNSEDIAFFITICNENTLFKSTPEIVQIYRRTGVSASFNLSNWKKSYYQLFDLIRENSHSKLSDLIFLRYKISRILFATYLSYKKYRTALFSATRFLFH